MGLWRVRVAAAPRGAAAGVAAGDAAGADDADAMKLLGGMKVTVADKSVNVEGRAAVDLLTWSSFRRVCVILPPLSRTVYLLSG